MTHGPLFIAFVYLAAGVVGVPIAKRLGLGSVLGYLLAGVAIGPFVLGVVGHEGHEIMHFAEFGVVMMLFLVGLELKPALLWSLRRPILGLGGLQVAVTVIAAALGAALLGASWKTSIAVGMTLAMSSTAIVLQSLQEKSLMKTPGGQASFSVLLFQDIAVIPILALFPLLASRAVASESTSEAMPAWEHALLVVLAVASVVLVGRFLVRPVFRALAATRLRETFTAAALLLVVGIALLMQSVGLSPALGTFLAGVVLAESEYRHELEADIEPFKGLLLGVFFVSVGAQIDFAFIAAQPAAIGGLVVATMALKLAVLYAIGRAFSLDPAARWLFALGLAQVGEFAFVLLSVGTQAAVFDEETAKLLVAVVALTMALTPASFALLERVVLPRLTSRRRPETDAVVDEGNPVIIAGHGRFGQIVGRMLRANGIGTTVLDLDPDMVELLRRLGVKVYYGDASRTELLETAGCAHAKLFVIAIDDTEAAVRLAHHLRARYPRLRILARARNRVHHYELVKAGANQVFRETFGSSYEMGVAAFEELGTGADEARSFAERWRTLERQSLEELSALWGKDEKTYFAAARRMLEEAERLIRQDVGRGAESPPAERSDRAPPP
jgi:monovalent cation:proton antiporter-2 (CPA2) family protein